MKKGQVWIETVIYTLIGLALIGVVLALITPKINEYRDSSTIEQAIASLNVMDSKISEVLQSPGNTRIVDFRLKAGQLIINPTDNKIYFTMDTKKAYSQPNEEISTGKIKILTTELTKGYNVKLSLDYNLNLLYEGKEENHTLTAASVPYKIAITNNGFDSNRKEIISISNLQA